MVATPEIRDSDIAVVSMVVRVPGATDPDTFWANLLAGVESSTVFSEEELRASGVDEADLSDPAYVRRGLIVEDEDKFDSSFFGYSPREATLIDPQQRVFLELAWEAFERAGYDPGSFGPGSTTRKVGVFAGEGAQDYWANNLFPHQRARRIDMLDVMMGTISDFLATRVSYRLNLRGPAFTLQCACSTSLVAVHQACQSLLLGEADLALAGGVSIRPPLRRGYLPRAGLHVSPDGRCRPFSAGPHGTIFGHGAAAVLLKRAQEAVDDGDPIVALIKGSAINNDGSRKIGFTAPSVDGQAAAILEAQRIADVDVETIRHVEAHGTGTELGDPVEVEALNRAFRRSTSRKGFCALSAVKANVGHLDAAAGVVGFVKTCLLLQTGQIPPLINLEEPNPRIDFAETPFYLPDEARPWPSGDAPRRAAVSALGMGGTNAHVVLEQAPEPAPSGPGRPRELLLFSARTPTALRRIQNRLADHLVAHPELSLADVAYTLAVGRRPMPFRGSLVAQDLPEAIQRLRSGTPTIQASSDRLLVFLFPGQGAQAPELGQELYKHEPVFREEVDRLAALAEPYLDADASRLLFPPSGGSEEARRRLDGDFTLQHFAIYIVSVAMARLLGSFGLQPGAMLGHSLGEYAAATLAGVLEPRDALRLVAARSRVFDAMPRGAMLGVELPAAEVLPLLGDGLDLGAANSPRQSTVSGTLPAVDALEERLREQGVTCHRLHLSFAAHSSMLEPFLDEFRQEVREVRLSPPGIPYLSCTTGDWITAEEATSPEYYVRHLRHTVQFSPAVDTLLADPRAVFVEVGPGTVLSSLTRMSTLWEPDRVAHSTLRHPKDLTDDLSVLLGAVGGTWAAGVQADFSTASGFFRSQERRRVVLPTYPFERQRCWMEPPEQTDAVASASRRPDMADWFYTSSWKRSPPLRQAGISAGRWWVLLDDLGVGDHLVQELRQAGIEQAGIEILTIRAGAAFRVSDTSDYTVSPSRPEDFKALVRQLGDRLPDRVLHLWNVTERKPESMVPDDLDEAVSRSFHSLVYLSQALADAAPGRPLEIAMAATDLHDVVGGERIQPVKALLLGPARVLPREWPGLHARVIDLEGRLPGEQDPARDAEILLAELAGSPEPLVATRGGRRWLPDHAPVPLPAPEPGELPVREDGICLVTGGFGGVGFVIAQHLAERGWRHIALLGRTPVPERADWDARIAGHGPDHPVSRRIQRVRELEALGAVVHTPEGDVADTAAMARVIEELRSEAPIRAVVHAAADVVGALLSGHTPERIQAALSAKVHGTLALQRLLADEPLDFFVLCSSLSSLAGPPGQLGYAAANNFLDALASAAGPPVTSILWDAWREVGRVVAAFEQPLGEPAVQEPSGTRLPLEHPILDARYPERSGVERAVGKLDTRCWLVDDHRLQGRAVMPGTGYLELVRAAVAARTGASAMVLTDVFFAGPMVLEEEAARIVEVVTTEAASGLTFFVRSRTPAGAWQDHVQGYAEVAANPQPQVHDIDEILREPFQRCVTKEDVRRTLDGLTQSEHGPAPYTFGPRWDAVRWIRQIGDLCVVRLALRNEFIVPDAGYGLHPALLDLAAPLLLLEGPDEQYEDHAVVAFGYERLEIHGRLPTRLYGLSRPRDSQEHGADLVMSDFSLVDEAGTEWVRAEGHTLRRVSASGEMVEAPPDAARPKAQAGQEIEAAIKEFHAENLRYGLRPAEGAEAFERAVASGLPQVIVSTRHLSRVLGIYDDLAASLHSAVEDPGSRPPSTAQPRPTLATEFVAPRDATEAWIARTWGELLGIEQVGVEDDFLELGGHSILAVAFSARVRSELGRDFPAVSIFTHRTAASVAAFLGEASEKPGGPVIPLKPGGDRPPWVVMPPGDGQVFCYQSLVPLLPPAQPLLGIQAVGLPEEPAENQEEMARRYLGALGDLPAGASLGGFCMGGVTALHMAFQRMEQGHAPPRLILLDSFAPGLFDGVKEQAGDRSAAFEHLDFLRELGSIHGVNLLSTYAALNDLPRADAEAVGRDLAGLDREARLEALFQTAAQAGVLEPEPDRRTFRQSFAFYWNLDRSGRTDPFEPYPGEVILFKASEVPTVDGSDSSFAGWETDPLSRMIPQLLGESRDNGWGPLAPQLRVIRVPGDHFSMLHPPNVEILARRIAEVFEEADAG